MIYDEPVYRPLGDMMLGVEFGDEANVALNFRVLELDALAREAKIPGVIETIPSLRELVLVLDRTQTTHAKVQDALDGLIGEVEEVSTLRSRKFVLPVLVRRPVVRRAGSPLRRREQPRHHRRGQSADQAGGH